MGIAEDMQMLQYLQQNQAQGNGAQQPMPQQDNMQQMVQPQKRNPLEAGSISAIESAKRSLEMNQSENQRALGRAIIGMMSSISQNPNYGKGFGGNLSAISGGFAPALAAYDSERDRIMQMNHALRMQQKEEERYLKHEEMLARKEEREMKRIAHDLEMENRRIKVAEGYLGLERTKHEDEKREHEEMFKAGAKIPISTMKPSQWNIAQKEIKSYIDQGESAHHALENIYQSKRILEEDPEITKNMATIMLAAQRHDPSIVGQKLNSWFISDKTRADAEMLAKNLSNLYTSKLKGFPARGMNMFLEKQLREGNVDINMSSSAIIKLLDADEKALKKIYTNAQEVYDEYEKGYFYRPRPSKLEGHEEEHEERENESVEMPEDKRQARIHELLKMRETAPE